MQNPGPSYIACTEDSVTRYVNTESQSSGHEANVSQRQHVVENPHNNNELERRRILRGACLIDSDDNNEDKTLQPQTQVQNHADTWRTRFSGNEPGAKSNPTAICHAPNPSIFDEITWS